MESKTIDSTSLVDARLEAPVGLHSSFGKLAQVLPDDGAMAIMIYGRYGAVAYGYRRDALPAN